MLCAADLLSSPAQLLFSFILRVLAPGSSPFVANDGVVQRWKLTLAAILLDPGQIPCSAWEHSQRRVVFEWRVRQHAVVAEDNQIVVVDIYGLHMSESFRLEQVLL